MNKILFGSRDIKKRNNSELTSSLSTDFNLLIELQWNIVDFICILSMSLRNSLGKFFIPVLWPVMQNLASSDNVYYRFWWSATYCPNHLDNYRPDLMLLSYFGCKLILGSKNASLLWVIMKCSVSRLFLFEIPWSYFWRWCKCVYMYVQYVTKCILNQIHFVVPVCHIPRYII